MPKAPKTRRIAEGRGAIQNGIQNNHPVEHPGTALTKMATTMIRGMEHLCCEHRLRELEVITLEKRKLQGDLIAVFQYLKWAYKKDGDKLFSRACCSRIRGNGFKLKSIDSDYI